MSDPQEPAPPASPEDPVAAPPPAQAGAGASAAAPPAPGRVVRPAPLGLALFGAAIALCVAAYLVTSVPGAWFPRAEPVTWGPADFKLARGTGVVSRGALTITGTDASQTALISIATDIRSTDYRAIAWDAANVPAGADVRMLWRSDYAPAKMNSITIPVLRGHLLPVELFEQPNWLGRISGIALVIRAPVGEPMVVRSATVKAMGAADLLRDRAREWFTLESWTGTSINAVAGGADAQEFPLPPLLAVAAALAMLAGFLLLRRAPQKTAFPMVVGVIFAAAWLVSDARWQWNLARQAVEAGNLYAGKDWHDKHVAAEDGELFSLFERIRAKLPAPPARVFMVAEAHYFRDRGAYHLYPHNVYFEPYRDALPPSSALRGGDYLVVYQRRGIQYDPAQKRLRFPDGSTVAAEVMLAESGAALFRIL